MFQIHYKMQSNIIYITLLSVFMIYNCNGASTENFTPIKASTTGRVEIELIFKPLNTNASLLPSIIISKATLTGGQWSSGSDCRKDNIMNPERLYLSQSVQKLNFYVCRPENVDEEDVAGSIKFDTQDREGSIKKNSYTLNFKNPIVGKHTANVEIKDSYVDLKNNNLQDKTSPNSEKLVVLVMEFVEKN